jgi:hypothetical protein
MLIAFSFGNRSGAYQSLLEGGNRAERTRVLRSNSYCRTLFVSLVDTLQGKLSLCIGVVAIILLLSPVFSAFIMDNFLVKALEKSFGKTTLAEFYPVRFSILLFGFQHPKITPKTIKFKETDHQALYLDLYQAKKRETACSLYRSGARRSLVGGRQQGNAIYKPLFCVERLPRNKIIL